MLGKEDLLILLGKTQKKPIVLCGPRSGGEKEELRQKARKKYEPCVSSLRGLAVLRPFLFFWGGHDRKKPTKIRAIIY